MQGSCAVRGQCTYTAQTAWIQNASLKDNILMGRPLYPARYDAVIKACALEQDLLALPAGASTVSTVCQRVTFPIMPSPSLWGQTRAAMVWPMH